MRQTLLKSGSLKSQIPDDGQSAIKQKGHYKDEEFMARLRELGSAYRLNIDFDDEGKIVATEESAPDIITALLDHRLGSGFSEEIYDVQATKAVGV